MFEGVGLQLAFSDSGAGVGSISGQRNRIGRWPPPTMDNMVDASDVQANDDGGLGLRPVHDVDRPQDVAGFAKITWKGHVMGSFVWIKA